MSEASGPRWRQLRLGSTSGRYELLYGALVAAVTCAYYILFYLPPRLVGLNDPDRFYHLAISRMVSEQGLIRVLPQVADLGWGSYFPDKEFLFHVLTGAADWIGGSAAVMLLVPCLGLAILLSLYLELVRVLKPYKAALLVLAVPLLSAAMMFRMTLLRPHVLAILCFCLLVIGILRGRKWQTALASAGFALSYHAFYLVVMVIAVAALFRWQASPGGARRWQWPLAGLACGIVLNPYFPSNVVMSWTTLQIALGMNLPPGAANGTELAAVGAWGFVQAFGFMPWTVLATAALIKIRALRPTPETAPLWFLFVLTSLLTILTMKSPRAGEYAAPCVVLLAGYAASAADRRWWMPLNLTALLALQGQSAWAYYEDIWSNSQQGDAAWYFSAISLLPPAADGRKVFNCEWTAGAYILYLRPELEFVDLLDPSLLWRVSPGKYLMRQHLIRGDYRDPHSVLRQGFGADYVVCGAPGLNLQMTTDKGNFRQIPAVEPVGPLKVFVVRPIGPSRVMETGPLE